MSSKRDRRRRSLAAAAAGAPGTDELGSAVDAVDIADAALHAAAELTAAALGAVGMARRAGYTWQEIGDALGISRQAAHYRYAAADERVAARRSRS